MERFTALFLFFLWESNRADSCFHYTGSHYPHTRLQDSEDLPPTHPIARMSSPDRLITVPQTLFKNPRIFVQGWTTGQFEHVTRQRWVVRRSMRITWRHKNLGQLHFSVLSVLMKSLGMNLSYELNKIDNSMIGI